MINVVGIFFIMICECARSCKFYPKLRLASGFTLTKCKRTATLQDVQPHNVTTYVCYGGSDNFSSGISGKLPKIATSNAIFSRTADRIAAKFCMAIKKIKSNDIFQNCFHSCSTLNKDPIWNKHLCFHGPSLDVNQWKYYYMNHVTHKGSLA